MYFLCKYLSKYFFLTNIPAHKSKLNLYLPLPIPFQILFSWNMEHFYFRSTLKSLGVILGGGLNIKVQLTSNYLYLCKHILHYSTVCDSLYNHTCIFPQYLILPIPFQTLTFLRQKWQMEGNTKQLNKLRKRLMTPCPS